ncbi:uncharacterized protein LOC110096859 [Dendrobium catenatum]|uniref:uncharacterized protein LOC110096859 n=1 Tax=Dendrobium catenatum TaxID=906689 RepID=UPI0010A095BE|nr:uncharacterized protein LOC110096859 [Dendrobium catenatum]
MEESGKRPSKTEEMECWIACRSRARRLDRQELAGLTICCFGWKRRRRKEFAVVGIGCGLESRVLGQNYGRVEIGEMESSDTSSVVRAEAAKKGLRSHFKGRRQRQNRGSSKDFEDPLGSLLSV